MLLAITWLLVSERGKTGAGATFGHFRAEIKAFKEMRPEKKTSGRDLDGGGNLVARKEAKMSQKMPGRSKTYLFTGRASFPALFQFISKNSAGNL